MFEYKYIQANYFIISDVTMNMSFTQRCFMYRWVAVDNVAITMQGEGACVRLSRVPAMFYDLWSGGGSIRGANAKFRSAHTIKVKLGHLSGNIITDSRFG